MKLVLVVLILTMLLSLCLVPTQVQATPSSYGPRSDLNIYFYTDTYASFAALQACYIDNLDCVLTSAQRDAAQADPNIQLEHVTQPTPRYDKFVKKCLPDLGQHSDGWCWLASLANSLIWYSQHGYCSLIPQWMHHIDARSLNPSNPHWYCPCGNGYKELFIEIAENTPNWHKDRDGDGLIGEDPIDGEDNDGDGLFDEDPPHKIFCEPVWQDEYEEMLKRLITNGSYFCVLNWTVTHNPTLHDYKEQLSKCEDVILWLDGPTIDHLVTGASFDNTKNPPEIDIADPWTDKHNNDQTHKKYEHYTVLNSTTLTIMYDWGNGPEPTPVLKMYHISPKDCCAYRAYKKWLVATVHVDDSWTFLNAYRADDPSQPIRYGISRLPEMLNPIYSYQYQDWRVLQRIYDPFLIQNPYDPSLWMPWLAQDWEYGTWLDPDTGQTKTKLTYWFRKDSEWIQPQTGSTLAPLTTSGYEFNCWYYFQTPDSGDYLSYADIHHIRPLGSYKVEVYLNSTDPPFEDDLADFRLYAPAWKRLPLATLETKLFIEGSNITTPGYVSLPYQTIGAPVEIVDITANGESLTPYTDYEMCMGMIRIYKDLPDGTPIQVTYWARGDAQGYTPGNLPWQEILIGTGPHYMTTTDLYTYSSFKANRNHFLETPLLGEIDWRWYYQDATKPRKGYYQINILDVVKCTAAYCTRGDGAPNPKWLPGADIDSYDLCHIGIFDLVTVTGKYGRTFGTPP